MPLARRPNTTEFPASRAKYAVRILIWWKWVSLKFSCNSCKFILPTIYIACESIRFSSLFVETSPRRRRARRNRCFRRLLFIGWEINNHQHFLSVWLTCNTSSIFDGWHSSYWNKRFSSSKIFQLRRCHRRVGAKREGDNVFYQYVLSNVFVCLFVCLFIYSSSVTWLN